MTSKAYLKKVCDAYREASKIPMLVSAKFEPSSSNNFLSVSTRWSQTNLATNKKIAFVKQVLVDKNTFHGEFEGASVSESGREMSRDGEGKTVIVRKPEKDECQNIEVWSRGKGLIATFNLKDVDKHGKIYTDSEFGALEISEDGKNLLYIAEKKKEKNVTFLFQGEVSESAKVLSPTSSRDNFSIHRLGVRLNFVRSGGSKWLERLAR